MGVDTSRMPEPMRRVYEERMARSPEQWVRDFLGGFFADAYDLDEVRQQLRDVAVTHPESLRRELAALEAFLAQPVPDGLLARLVGWEGNWVLDDPSDDGARVFLGEVADMLREVIAEAPPPRRFRRGG